MRRTAVLVVCACLIVAGVAGGIFLARRHRPAGPIASGVSQNAGLYPWTSSRPVTTQDLQGLSRRQLDIMRNEIYARHGWIFQTPFWNSYFKSQSWYHPKAVSGNVVTTDKKLADDLSAVEVANIAKIMAYKKSLGSPAQEEPIIFSRNGNIYSVAPDGSKPVQLTGTGDYTISDYVPDEGKILCIRRKKTQGYPGGDVVSIDMRTGGQTLLLPASASGVSPDGSIPGFDLALLSPDGRKLVVGEPNPAVPGDDLYLVAPDGSNLSRQSLARLVCGVAFNPHGTGLAFENERSDVGPVSIYDMAWDQSPVPLLPLNAQGLWAGSFAWRPDGKAIAFAGSTDNMQGPAQSENNGIYLVTTGGQVTELCPLPAGMISALHWLGAGRLSFVTTPVTGDPNATGLVQVYTYDIQAGKLDVIMSFPAKGLWTKLSWNPDNTAFVFSRGGSLWLKDLSSGEERQIPGTQGAGDFEW